MSSPSSEPRQGGKFFVGIGSSAGGLEAVSLLAQNLPTQANAVYILAQHMSPVRDQHLWA